MAEEKTEDLEGFDDLDGLLDEDAGGGGDDEFSGELDDFLGADDEGGGDAPGADDAGGGDDGFGLGDDAFGGDDDLDAGDEGDGGDSELDSFFEDLSTIDDLEVSQEEAPPEEAPAEAPEEAGEPAEEAPAEAPAAVAAVAAAAPVPAGEKKKQPWLKRAILLILLGLVGGSGYFAYTTFFPSDGEAPWPEIPVPELPWPLVEEILEEEPMEKQPAALLPLPPAPLPLEKPAAPAAMAPPSAPVAAAAPAPAKGKGYGVQVATCFFAKCVNGFQKLLARNNRSYSTLVKSRKSESLEIVSGTTFEAREIAEQIANRINAEHRLEGQAFVARSGGGYKISMGTFPDLARAILVKDSLNQRLEGEVFFNSLLKSRTYRLSKVITGRYASPAEARRELQALRRLDRRFKGAFIVRN